MSGLVYNVKHNQRIIPQIMSKVHVWRLLVKGGSVNWPGTTEQCLSEGESCWDSGGFFCNLRYANAAEQVLLWVQLCTTLFVRKRKEENSQSKPSELGIYDGEFFQVFRNEYSITEFCNRGRRALAKDEFKEKSLSAATKIYRSNFWFWLNFVSDLRVIFLGNNRTSSLWSSVGISPILGPWFWSPLCIDKSGNQSTTGSQRDFLFIADDAGRRSKLF